MYAHPSVYVVCRRVMQCTAGEEYCLGALRGDHGNCDETSCCASATISRSIAEGRETLSHTPYSKLTLGTEGSGRFPCASMCTCTANTITIYYLYQYISQYILATTTVALTANNAQLTAAHVNRQLTCATLAVPSCLNCQPTATCAGSPIPGMQRQLSLFSARNTRCVPRKGALNYAASTDMRAQAPEHS